ncbi:hypothetical protein THRCLA_21106 [Thraustotheca clavata]|uniref:Secreted protein n=1 Tax=Thraustotheca clavata TaxID=74557 RepID=A0A1W0A074_9STRA|nr:hypothetical protein THRCLA_21106 [Thraustotheca clavata]
MWLFTWQTGLCTEHLLMPSLLQTFVLFSSVSALLECPYSLHETVYHQVFASENGKACKQACDCTGFAIIRGRLNMTQIDHFEASQACHLMYQDLVMGFKSIIPPCLLESNQTTTASIANVTFEEKVRHMRLMRALEPELTAQFVIESVYHNSSYRNHSKSHRNRTVIDINTPHPPPKSSFSQKTMSLVVLIVFICVFEN